MAKPRTDGYNSLVNSSLNEQDISTGRRENVGADMNDIRRNSPRAKIGLRRVMMRWPGSWILTVLLHINASCFAVLGLQTAFKCRWCTTADDFAQFELNCTMPWNPRTFGAPVG